MAEFNPDQFLAETPAPKGFDPDAFLASNDATPVEPKPLPETDLTSLKTFGEANLNAKKAESEAGPKEAETFLEAFEAGFQISVDGLILRGRKPDIVLPENAPMFHRIVHQASTIVGDLPAMVAGTVGGAAGGAAAGTAAAGPVGTVLGGIAGAGAGGNALPTVIRESLMDAYEKGSVDSFSEFWERAAPVMWNTAKSAAVGAVTMGVGNKVGKVVAPLAAPIVAKSAAAASEIATMTTVGAALDGRMPEPHEFTDAAILIGGLHTAGHVGGKLRKTFGKTGNTPDVVVQEAQNKPTIYEDLVSKNIDIPRALDPEKPPEIEVRGEMGAINSVFGDADPVKLQVKETNILDHIGEDAKPESITMNDVVQNMVDDLDPIKRITKDLAQGKNLDGNADPYVLARTTRGSSGLVKHFVEHGTVDFTTGKVNGKPLKQIFDPIKTDVDGFKEFMIAKRAQELHGRNIESGLDPLVVDEAVAKGSKKFQKAFDDLQDYQNKALSYLRDSGVLSEDAFNNIQEANKSYVPMFRIMDEGASGQKNAGKGLNVRNPVKKIKGSDRKIVDPVESIVKNTALFIQMAEKNRAVEALVKLSEGSGTNIIEKVPAKMKPIEVTAKEVQKFLDDHGIDGDGEAFNIFRPQKKQLASDEIAVFRDGKREVYKVPEDLAKAINHLDREAVGLLTKIMATPASLLRAGSTLSPDFIARNFIRDQMTAFHYSKNGYIPVADFLAGMGSLLKKDTHYWDWMKNGGMNSHMTAIDQTYLADNVYGIAKETGFLKRTRNVITAPIELMRVMSEITENATRLGDFKRGAKKGDSKKAAFDSREVTLDFAKIGAKTQAMNMITAFWNAHVQGLARGAQAFKENPVGTTAKIAASVTLPSIALWWANHDDPRWKDIPRWQKDLFWIVMTDDTIYRIPKPFEIGLLFGSLPERALEAYFTENPNAFGDFQDSLKQAFAPGIIPTAVLPAVEQYANKNMFTGMPVIPWGKEDLIPELQYSDYTSETAKLLSSLVGQIPGARDSAMASPAVIENYVSAWSGTLGRYSLELADKALIGAGLAENKVRSSTPLEKKPIIKAFMIRYPSAQAQSIQDFYEKAKEAEKVRESLKQYQKEGRTEDAAEFAKENVYQLRSFSFLKNTREALKNMRKFIDAVEANPKVNPDEKRQIIDGIYLKMIEASKLANQRFEAMKKNNFEEPKPEFDEDENLEGEEE